MHRMGRGGSKMREFSEFAASVEALWPTIWDLRQATPESLDAKAWRNMERVFRGLRCMKTGTSLVGHSKIMAHALPRLVPPIDRNYTLKFLYGTSAVSNDLDREWDMLSDMLRQFFYPLLRERALRLQLRAWVKAVDKYPWDTSPLKTLDNLVIGAATL